MNTARRLVKMLLLRDGSSLLPSMNLQSHLPYLSFAVSNPGMKYTMVWKSPMEPWSLVCLLMPSVSALLTDSNSAAVYSARYISDRFLPDKAIDLVDEAASA